MTTQDKLKAQLEKAGIPYKEIHCYGSQVMITAWSFKAAKEWANLLTKFCSGKVRVVESRDETKDPERILKANPGLVKSHFYHEVWRIGATI